MKCPACGSEMTEEATAFVKCTNKECRNSTYGIRKSPENKHDQSKSK